MRYMVGILICVLTGPRGPSMVLRVFCRVIMIGRARKIKPEDEVMERERE